MAQARVGATICELDDLIFPVELRDNERNTNQEYNKVVVGELQKKVPFMDADEMQEAIDGLETDEAIELLESHPDTKRVFDKEIDLNYCSPRYELVPNETIFPKVEEVFREKEIDFSVQYSHTHNARFYGNFIIEDPRFAYKMNGTNDVIKFIWNFQHSYNGLTKYKGIAGFYRMVCTNGLVVPIEEMKEFNLCIQGKHTSSILNSLKDFSQILLNVSDNLDTVKTAITDKYEKLGGVWVPKPEDRIKEVLQATKIAMIDIPRLNTLNDITSRVMSEANKVGLGYNGKVNNWLIYNGINQYLNDDNLNIASPEKRRDKDSAVLEYMLEYS